MRADINPYVVGTVPNKKIKSLEIVVNISRPKIFTPSSPTLSQCNVNHVRREDLFASRGLCGTTRPLKDAETNVPIFVSNPLGCLFETLGHPIEISLSTEETGTSLPNPNVLRSPDVGT